MLKKWDEIPEFMKNDEVREYYDVLDQKRGSLLCKRIFDIVIALVTLTVLSPVFLIVSIIIKLDSKGPIMFRQVRVTQYGKQFRIFKFRTMVNNAEKLGTQVTTKNDTRVTTVGKFLRTYRLDEFPQLLNIISGNMSFVGTRPEVEKYVEQYSEGMRATLLMPAGITSIASIRYKDEEKLLEMSNNVDKVYLEEVLPEKMKYNLRSIKSFNLSNDLWVMVSTLKAVLL